MSTYIKHRPQTLIILAYCPFSSYGKHVAPNSDPQPLLSLRLTVWAANDAETVNNKLLTK